MAGTPDTRQPGLEGASLDWKNLKSLTPPGTEPPTARVILDFPAGSDWMAVSETAGRVSHLLQTRVEYKAGNVLAEVTPFNIGDGFSPEKIRERIAARGALLARDPENDSYRVRNEMELRFARLLYGEDFH